jgi:hypothetical protein
MFPPMHRFTYLVLPVCLFLVACKKTEPAPGTPPATYNTRGILKSLPEGEDRTVQILHEAIPTFKDASGEVRGMDSMEMPFSLDKAINANDLAVGDKIVFQFETRFGQKPTLVVTTIAKMPPETPLTVKE